MKVFISWSGDTSRELALVLREWLPDVLQSIQPWVSSEDIAKGQLWVPELTTALQEAKFGLCCLTPENVSSPWMAFEAGAMVAYQKAKERVSPVLLGLKPADAIGPYGSLQHTQFTVEDFTRLLSSINAVGEQPIDKERLERAVSSHWGALDARATKIRAKAKPADVEKAQRTDKEVLSEVLELVRSQGNMLSQLAFRAGVVGGAGARSPLRSAFAPTFQSGFTVGDLPGYQSGFTLGNLPSYVGAGSFVDPELARTPVAIRASEAAAAPATERAAAKPENKKK